MILWKIAVLLLVLLSTFVGFYECRNNAKGNVVEEIGDFKDFKKILRTKNNVLSLFVSNSKRAAPMVKVFKEAANAVRGEGTMLSVECNGDGKKLCKKLKVSPDDAYTLRHYKDGEYNKEYDRKETVQSLVNFMKDPTGDLPWEEEPTATNITHIANPQSLQKLLDKEQRPVMVMFYAPWCGFCKKMKPDYAAAATELKEDAVLAAIDVNRPENAAVRVAHNITGFPTLLYFRNGELKYTYEGDNNKEKLVEFIRNPTKRAVKQREAPFFESSNVKQLTSENFDSVIASVPSVLVMFYAPWCGYCKKMKPQYEEAATKLKEAKVKGLMAAVDATKEPTLASKYKVSGYPTVKYFKNGTFVFDVGVRETGKLVDFMKEPKAQLAAAPAPEPETPWSEQASYVAHLSAENVKQELRKKRHSLVMFYAPWCGHCKKAKPEFTAAAEQLKDNSRALLAAIDCSVHETLCKFYEVKGYPTFKYFHYYNKYTTVYNGGRTTSDFVNYFTDIDNRVLKDLQKSKDEL